MVNVCCVVALILGMLMFHMLKNVCGCNTVEGSSADIKLSEMEKTNWKFAQIGYEWNRQAGNCKTCKEGGTNCKSGVYKSDIWHADFLLNLPEELSDELIDSPLGKMIKMKDICDGKIGDSEQLTEAVENYDCKNECS